jgi:DNA-binding LacI/PurR family transcriptional regulator
MKHSTIIDIAKKLGISASTVSRALSNHPDIRKDTKDRVNKIAKELNYTPNPIARSLKNSTTKTIGVQVPEIKHDFFSSAISGIEDAAYKAGYTILVSQSNENNEREIMNTRMLIQHRVAGILVSISQTTQNSNHFKEVLTRNIPLVFFDRVSEEIKASKVIIDDYRIAFDAVSFLVTKGYKRIAHFGGPKQLNICLKRFEGYKDALNKAGLPIISGFIKEGGLHEPDGYEMMDIVMKGSKLPDAIFAVNDPVAIGAFQRIRESSLRIPEDIALMGFSNNKITSLVNPPLSTVNQPSYEMGKKAAEILIEQIEGKDKTIRTVILEASLIKRGST